MEHQELELQHRVAYFKEHKTYNKNDPRLEPTTDNPKHFLGERDRFIITEIAFSNHDHPIMANSSL